MKLLVKTRKYIFLYIINQLEIVINSKINDKNVLLIIN